VNKNDFIDCSEKNKIERKQKLKTKRKKIIIMKMRVFLILCAPLLCVLPIIKKNFKLCKPTTGSKKTHTVNDKVYSM